MENQKQTLCFLTAGRMDFGLITPILKLQSDFPDFDFQILSLGDQDNAIRLINEAGFEVTAALETMSNNYSAAGIAQNFSNTAEKIGPALSKINPDLIIIPGDRYEMVACASIATIMGFPIAHLYGGDISYGAFDESFRHAITKMAHLHFTTNEDAKKRVIQMGENPEHVFNCGAPALDLLTQIDFMDKCELGQDLGAQFGKTNIVITYHPVTRSDSSAQEEIQHVLNALEKLPNDHHLFFTLPGPDNDAGQIIEKIRNFEKAHDHAYAFDALGSKRYLSLLNICDMVLGNSSSGFYEAPSFKIPTVNIGDRQQGRLAAQSILHCPCETTAIIQTIEKAKTMDCATITNPYYKSDAARQILEEITHYNAFKPLIKKAFFEKL